MPSAAADRAAGRGRGLDGLDAAFTGVFALVAVWSWSGLTLAEIGQYNVVTFWLLAGLPGIGAGWWVGRRLRREAAIPLRVGGAGLWLAVWVALAAALFTPPGEYVINGGDGSVYLNIGRALARHGGLTYREPLLDRLETSDWPAVLHLGRAWPRLFDLFPGGIQLATAENRVRPNFFHLLPVWIANLETMAGPRAGYYGSPLFAVLAVAALWLLAREISSPLAAGVAAALLTISVAEVWFARFPASEILAQFFILSGLYFASLWMRHNVPVVGLCAGAAFGLAAFTRIDALLLVSPLVAAFFALTAGRQRPSWWRVSVATFGLLTLQATAHALLLSAPYTLRVLGFLLASPWANGTSLVIPPLVLGAGLLCYVAYRRRGHPFVRGMARAVFIGLLGLAAVRLWPGLAGGYAAMLLTPLGIALAAAGAVLLLWTDARPHVLLIVGLLLVWTLVYVDAVRDQAQMPTLFRRFVPVILPLGLLLAAHAVAWAHAASGRVRWAALGLPVVLLLSFAVQTRPLIATAPMQGVHDQLARIDGQLPAGAFILVDATTPSHFGLSLRYTFGRDVLHVTPGHRTASVLGKLAASLERDGLPLMLAVGRGTGPRALGAEHLVRVDLAPAGTVTLEHVEIEPTSDRMPSGFRRLTSAIDLYRASLRRPRELPVQLEIGDRDLALAGGGFYAAEVMGTARARWTGAVARIVLPQLATASRAALLLQLAAPRPPGVAAPTIALELDGEPIGRTAAVPPGFTTMEVSLDPATLARLATSPAVLTLRTPTFVPKEHGMNEDGRQLGAAVDWIRIESR